MSPELEDRLAKEIHRILKRSGTPDPISATERVLDVVTLMVRMESEESGISAIRHTDSLVQEKPVVSAPPPSRAVMPIGTSQDEQPRPKSSLILPGDPEFKDPPPQQVRPGVIRATEVRRKPSVPASNSQQRQYWDYVDLQDTINANTPENVSFDTEGPGGKMFHITCIRNTVCQIGQGMVILSYRHPSVSEYPDAGRVIMDLIAKFPFSVYEKELDFNEAMSGEHGIVRQLKGMYIYRPVAPQPRTVDMGLRPENAFGTGQERIDLQPGEDPGDQRGNFMSQLFEENKRYSTPSGR